jgi:hypothetical protein
MFKLSGRKFKKLKILIKTFFVFLGTLAIIISLFSPFPFEKGPLKEILKNLEPQYAKAHYQYAPASQSIVYGRSKTNDYRAF